MERHQSSQKACNKLSFYCKPIAEDDSKITSSAYIKQSILLLFRYTGSWEDRRYFGRSFIKNLNKFGLKTFENIMDKVIFQIHEVSKASKGAIME